MQIDYSNRFIKLLKKAPLKIQLALRKRLEIFTKDKFAPVLRNHPLTGNYANCRSINITGDWRAIFKEIDKDHVYFIELGTHNQLYK